MRFTGVKAHSLGAASGLAWARIRARPSRGLTTGLGVAVAAAALIVTVAAPQIAGDIAVRGALNALPPQDRSVTVAATTSGLTPDALADIDRKLRQQLQSPGLGRLRAQVEYRALAAPAGKIFRLGGVDGLREVIALRSGRLPESCTPQRCEVVAIVPGAELELPAGIGVTIVGTAALLDPTVLSGSFKPDVDEVMLLGDGFQNVAAIAPLDLIGRSTGWVAAIDPAVFRTKDIASLFAAVARTTNTIGATTALITLPDDALQLARSRSRAAGNRAVLAASQGVLLLMSFVLLAAAGARREHMQARDLLRRRGASRRTLNWFTTSETLWPIMIGLGVGLPAGAGVIVWIEQHWHLGGRGTLANIATDGWPKLVIGATITLAATAAILAWPAATPRARAAWQPTPFDALGVGALLMAALAIGRGNASANALAAGGDPLLAMLPVIAAVVIAWVALRIIPILVRLAVKALRRRAPLTRVSLGEVGWKPTLPLATTAFLSATTMLGVFAIGYRTTLDRGATDQAGFAVPFDITLNEGPALVRPSSTEPVGGWSALAPGVTATAVLRRGVTVVSKNLSADSVELLGVDPATLPSLRVWRSDFGPNPSSFVTEISARPTPAALGTPIPEDTESLLFSGTGDLETTAVFAVLSRGDGSWREATADYSPDSPNQIAVTLESGDAGGRFIGFRLGQRGEASDRTQHKIGEGTRQTDVQAFTASITFTEVTAAQGSQRTALAIDWSGLASDGALLSTSAVGLTVDLRLQGSSALVLPRSPVTVEPMPAIVDPITADAADQGVVSIEVASGLTRSLKIVGVTTRFPGAPSRFAVVDIALAQPSLDLADPGFGTAIEAWLAVPASAQATVAKALTLAPYSDLTVQNRQVIEAVLRDDPLASFTLGLFAAAAAIAAILAAGAVYLSTLANAAAQAPLHRALVAEGVTARSLGRMVRINAVVLSIAAAGLGTIAALLLLRVVARVIAVTATSTVPVPPLLAQLGGWQIAAALTIVIGSCSVAATLAARTARRIAHSDVLREFG